MFFFKNKFDKLTREDVVDAICKLVQEEKDLEDDLASKSKQVDELMAKGRAEKSQDVRLFYAKKITNLKADREQNVQRAMYLMYNIRLLNKLKNAIDDNKFFKNTSNMSLGNLLADQKGIAKFLNQALGTRVSAEDVLTSADETFRQVEEAYDKNESIYGVSENDDALLAMFETEDQVEAEQEMFAEKNKESSENTEK